MLLTLKLHRRLTNMFAGNLVAQNNEINLLKLTYAKDSENKNLIMMMQSLCLMA